jgi:hypothetical protein
MNTPKHHKEEADCKTHATSSVNLVFIQNLINLILVGHRKKHHTIWSSYKRDNLIEVNEGRNSFIHSGSRQQFSFFSPMIRQFHFSSCKRRTSSGSRRCFR